MRESGAVFDAPSTEYRRSTGPYRVRAETIGEFARAVRDSPRRVGAAGLAAPASFAATILTGVIGDVLTELIPDAAADRILHVDQVLDLRRPLRDGDRLTCRTAVDSFRHFADYHVLAIRTALVDHRGVIAQSGTTSLLTRVGGDSVPSPPRADRRPRRPAPVRDEIDSAAVDFEDLSIGYETAPWSVLLTRAELDRYARLTGATGIAPSTVELAFATTYLARRLGPEAIVRRLRAQSSRHLHHLSTPASETVRVEFRGRVTGLDIGRRRATLALTAHSGNRALFGHAAVDVYLPNRRHGGT
ncbi:FAS1-like dehydratase domain-containing protein [Nocardia arizonensis]|uniref:FAS1-like dehydratase domain-containing protein n=1 Tax=Nocardia arizonensis TaxID=1141647 RepID=UPI0006D033B8|nr:MaoC family dehydratase N-terminal domain-containing protein [Nocardia arizonensis]